MINLSDGTKARIIEELNEELVPYCTSNNPSGTCGKYELYINLQTGAVFAYKGAAA